MYVRIMHQANRNACRLACDQEGSAVTGIAARAVAALPTGRADVPVRSKWT